MQTPNSVDVYSRFMVDMFDEKEIIGVSTVWQSFFGKPAHGNSKTIYSPDSLVVDIDVVRRNERIAALVHRGTNSRDLNTMKNTATQNFSSFSRRYPLAEELGDITGHQINHRLAGENPYESKSRMSRTRELALEHHLEHIRRYVRLFEVIAGMSLLGGQHPAIGLNPADPDDWYDFRRNAAHIITPAVPWNQPAANILQDIDAGCRLMRENGKVSPNVIFFGQNVFPVFINNLNVQTLADNRRFELIEVSTNNPVPPMFADLVAGGAIPRGLLRTPEGWSMWMFTYVDIFTDDNGDAQHYMPLNSCFMAYYGARCDRYFGPPERLPVTSVENAWYQEMFGMNMLNPVMPANIKNRAAIITPQMFYFDAYAAGDKKKVTIRTQSAPIYATTQTDAFVTFVNVLGSES
jgi:hypothetical protein